MLHAKTFSFEDCVRPSAYNTAPPLARDTDRRYTSCCDGLHARDEFDWSGAGRSRAALLLASPPANPHLPMTYDTR